MNENEAAKVIDVATWDPWIGLSLAVVLGVIVLAALVWVAVGIVRKVRGLPPGVWATVVERWDWKPFRPMFVVAAGFLFVLTVKILDQFFGLLETVLPRNLPPEAQWYIDGAIAGSLFMGVLLIMATGYNAFATALQNLTKDDSAPAPEPDRVAQVCEFADKVHKRDSERFAQMIEAFGDWLRPRVYPIAAPPAEPPHGTGRDTVPRE